MFIENVKIGSFGKLSQTEYNLTSGVNLIEGKNESGKSTLCEFIKFVFYGLSNKGSDGEMSERKRYISWKSNEASGSVVINTGDERYRIERSVTAHGTGYKDSVTVVDLSSNSVVSGIKIPGEYFFGIPEDVFTRTVYVRQSEGAYFDGSDIGQAVENIFYSADESVNTEKALKKLDEARTKIKHKKNTGRGLIDELERERDELESRLAEARHANEVILRNEASLKNTLASIEKNKKECAVMAAQMRKAELYGTICKFDEKNKYEKAVEAFKKGKAEVISATTFNGFFPDSAYISELHNLKNELKYLKSDLDAYKSNEGLGEAADYSEELADEIRAWGGRKAIMEAVESFGKKKKLMLVLTAVLGVFGVIAGAVGGFTLKALGLIAAIILAAGIALVATAVVCAVISFINGGKLKNILYTFDADDEESLEYVINGIEESEKYELQRREMLLFHGKKREEAEANLNECLKRAEEVLARWGVVPESEDYEGVNGKIDDVLEDIGEISGNIAVYDREIEKNEAVLLLMESQLAGISEGEIRAEYQSIEYDFDPANAGEIKKRYNFTVMAKEALAAKVTELEKSLAEQRAVSDRPSDLESRLKVVRDSIKELNFKHDAYLLAHEKLLSAGTTLRAKLAPGLSEASGRLMGGITDGKYKEIGVSDGLEMTYTFEEDGTYHTKSIDYVSSGTKDVAYVSLRLALAEMFSRTGQRLPVVFDEAFARLDDDRLTRMLGIAEAYAKDGGQAVILTSHKREGNIVEKLMPSADFNRICLD